MSQFLLGAGMVAGFLIYGSVLLGALYAVRIVGEWAEARFPRLVSVPLIILLVAAWCAFVWASWQALERLAGLR